MISIIKMQEATSEGEVEEWMSNFTPHFTGYVIKVVLKLC